MVKRALIVALLLAAAAVAPPLTHQVRKSRVARTSLKVGDAAPDFTLLTDEWKTVRLSEYRGKKNVFLAVYVLAFSEGCTKQMRAVQAGIDSGQMLTSYGILKTYSVENEDYQWALRANIVIDKQGIIRLIDEGDEAVDPNTALTLCTTLHKQPPSD